MFSFQLLKHACKTFVSALTGSSSSEAEAEGLAVDPLELQMTQQLCTATRWRRASTCDSFDVVCIKATLCFADTVDPAFLPFRQGAADPTPVQLQSFHYNHINQQRCGQCDTRQQQDIARASQQHKRTHYTEQAALSILAGIRKLDTGCELVLVIFHIQPDRQCPQPQRVYS
jgi:hypothetical protein